jgi:hypothetical protein
MIALTSAGCFTIQPVRRPADFIPQTNPELVWIRQQDGEVLPVARPSLLGDTLVGIRAGTPEPVRVALPRIQSISARQPDTPRTLLVAVTGFALAGFIAWRATKGSGSPNYCFITSGGEFHCPGNP